MDEKTLLKRSPRGLQAQVISSAVVTLLIGFLSSWLLNKLLGWTDGGGTTAKAITWLILIVMWAGASLKLWYDWKVKRYEIARDALIVHAKAGKLGMAQTIYRYESIISLRMTQGFLGKQFGYGDIRITIPKIDHEVVMNDIERPSDQLLEIQRRLGERSHRTDSTAALIN
ncbi:MAG: PH domain-containing protein [Candidatus Saccharimonadales bacterium]